MKPRIRIRPRIWLALPKPLARLGWIPLSLTFRKQRLPERVLPGAAGSPITLFSMLSFLSQIHHHQANEQRQIFARSIQHRHFFLNRVGAQRTVPTKGSRHPEAITFHELRRERSMEMLLHYWTLRESRQSFTATHHVREITKQLTDGRPQRVWLAEPPVAAPAQRLLATSELLHLRLFAPGSLSAWQPEAPRGIRRQTLQAAEEDQLTPRHRKADSSPAPVSTAAWTAPLVPQVWRQPQRALQDSLTAAGRLPATAQTMPTNSLMQHKVDLAPPPSVPPVLPGKVEGPTMERIAEDVMKRIERHLRIERERRGL